MGSSLKEFVPGGANSLKSLTHLEGRQKIKLAEFHPLKVYQFT